MHMPRNGTPKTVNTPAATTIEPILKYAAWVDPAALIPCPTPFGDSKFKLSMACPVGAEVKFSGAICRDESKEPAE